MLFFKIAYLKDNQIYPPKACRLCYWHRSLTSSQEIPQWRQTQALLRSCLRFIKDSLVYLYFQTKSLNPVWQICRHSSKTTRHQLDKLTISQELKQAWSRIGSGYSSLLFYLLGSFTRYLIDFISYSKNEFRYHSCSLGTFIFYDLLGKVT